MEKKQGVIVLTVLLAITLFTTFVYAAEPKASVYVGNYSVSNPKILVNYSELVRLESTILVDRIHPDPYVLCQQPKKDEYTKNFELYTKTGADPDTCEGGDVRLLEPGNYSLTLQAINRDGNATIDTLEFTINGLDIQFITPAHGIANKTPYNIKFWTSEEAICKYAFTSDKSYSSMTPTVEADAYVRNHRVLGLNYSDSDFFVICKEKSGRMTAKTLKIGYDNTPPVFQDLAAIPSRVINPNDPYSGIIVKTDDKTICTVAMCGGTASFFNQDGREELPEFLELYNSSHASTFYYNQPPCNKSTSDLSYQSIPNNVTCRNLAGYASSQVITVALNFSQYSYINVLSPDDPINTSTFTVTVQPESFTATSCTLDGRKMNAASAENTFSLDKIIPPNPKKIYTVTLNITCENDVKTAERSYTLTVDTVPPPAPIIEGGDSVCSGYLPVKFSVPDGSAVSSYTYTVTDGAAFNIQNTTDKNTFELQLPANTPSHVKWSVYATDDAGNQGPVNETEYTLSEGDDETCGLPPFITIRSPHLGFSEVAPYDLVLETAEASECRYSLDKQTSWTQMSKFVASEQDTAHLKSKITQDSQDSTLMFVQCIEKETDKAHYKRINLGVDNTAPKISVRISPNTINEDPKFASVEVITDDLTYCRHTNDAGAQFTLLPDDQQRAYTKSHYSIFDYRTAEEIPQEHEFDVTCTNLVGMDTTVTALLAIDVAPAIEMEILSPNGFSSSASNELTVRTNTESVCIWHKAGYAVTKKLEEDNGNYTSSLGTLEDGSNFFAVWCEADGQNSVVAVSVTVDRSLPGVKNIQGPSSPCTEKSAQYAYEVIGLDDNPIISYSVESDDGLGASFQANTTDRTLTVPFTGISPGKHTLNIIPINKANVKGAKVSIPLTVLASTDEICMQDEGHCTDKTKNPGEEGIDCGGTCPDACISCFDKYGCPNDMTCMSGVCVKQNSCTNDDECSLTERCENNVCVDASCTSNTECDSTAICIEGICNAPPSCASNDDCAVPYSCVENICVLPVCGNVKLDAEEVAVDCGGSCPVCISCKTKDDCKAAQSCNAGYCASPSCNVTADCDENHVCQQGACIPVFVCTTDESCPAGTCMQGICKSKSCSTFKDCLRGQDCENNFCVKGISCTGDDSCTNGKSCVSGTCVNGCELDSQCRDGTVCKNNVCTAPEVPKPECVADEQCMGEDEICVEQRCVVAPKSHIVSYILLALGLLIMGGAGYFLYQQDAEKKRIAAENARTRAAAVPPKKVFIAPQLSSQQNPSQSPSGFGRIPLSGMDSKPAAKPVLQKSSKDIKRNSFFDAFDTGVEGTVSTVKDKRTADATGTNKIDAATKEDDSDDGFINIDDIKKTSKKDVEKDGTKDLAKDSTKDSTMGPVKDEASTKESSSSKKSSKKDDPFSDLDKIGK